MKRATMTLRRPRIEDFRYVTERMRERDREEVFATQHRFDAERDGSSEDDIFTEGSYAAATTGGLGFTAAADGEPVAIFGMTALWPGVASVWMVATDRLPDIGLQLTKFSRQAIISCMNSGGIHRAQAWSMAGHSDSHRWLRLLGAKEEAIVPGYGRDGQTFHLFGWVKGRDF